MATKKRRPEIEVEDPVVKDLSLPEYDTSVEYPEIDASAEEPVGPGGLREAVLRAVKNKQLGRLAPIDEGPVNEMPELDLSNPQAKLKDAVMRAVAQKYNPAPTDPMREKVKQQFLAEAGVEQVGDPVVESVEEKNARLAEAAMPPGQITVPPPDRNPMNQAKTTEQMLAEARVARGQPTHAQLADEEGDGDTDAPTRAPGMPVPNIAGAAKGASRVGGSPNMQVGELELKPTPVKARQPTMNDAFRKNELALAFENTGLKPEEAQQSEYGPEYRQDALNTPNQDPPAADPRRAQATPGEGVVAQVPPKDRRPYWAALQGVIENAWRMGGQDAPKGGYYQGLIAQAGENQKLGETQKDRDAKVASEQAGRDFTHTENEANRGVQRERDTATQAQAAAQLAATEANRSRLDENTDRAQTETERHNRELERLRAMQRAGGAPATVDGHPALKPAQVETAVGKAMKNAPDPQIIGSYKDIMARLNDPTPLGGMDAASATEKTFNLVGGLPIVGHAFQRAGEGLGDMMKSQETIDLLQKAEAIKDHIRIVTTGMAMTDSERNDFRKRVGLNGGDSAFRLGIKNEMAGDYARFHQWFDAQHPQVQERLREAGMEPPEMPKANYGAYPGGKSNYSKLDDKITDTFSPSELKSVDEAVKKWLAEKFGRTPPDFDQKRGVYTMKANEDPEFREMLRKNAKID